MEGVESRNKDYLAIYETDEMATESGREKLRLVG